MMTSVFWIVLGGFCGIIIGIIMYIRVQTSRCPAAAPPQSDEADERTRIMIDTMAFACYFFDEEGNAIDCNQRAVELYRCKDKKELLEKFFTLSPERQNDGSISIVKAKGQIRRAFREGKTVFSWDHIAADGTPLPVEVTLIRVKWKDEYRVVAYARDLSEITETQDNLIRISVMMNGSPNPVIYLGEQGNIEYMNPAVSAVSGYTNEELYHYGLPLIFTNENLLRLNEDISLARKNRDAQLELNINLINKLGENLDFMFSIFPAPLYGGKVGVGLLGRNITEFKQVQRDLVQAKEAAEQSLVREASYNKAKADFLSRISHEMRTPMNAIIGMTGIAKKAGNEEQCRCFEVIESASNRLLDMVNDILDVTSFDTGGFDCSLAPFSFSAAMRLVSDTVMAKAQAKGQRFITAIEDEIPDTLISDEGRLRQLLLKLLFNGVKFTPEGGTVGLSVGFIGESEGGDCILRFEVWDTGIGITPEKQERLWEPFEQGDSSITREHEGLGLGLHLVKRIVELLKGTIRLESEPGKGSRFTCDLCFGQEGARNGKEPCGGQDIEKFPAVVEGPLTRDLTGRRVLVVDDNEVNRDIVFTILEDTGAELEGAKNGAEAVNKFSEKKYDLVIMDLHMPVMNGLEATRKIRCSALPWAKTTPVISLSADTSARIRFESREAGISDYLSKPINMDLLLQKIAQWLPA